MKILKLTLPAFGPFTNAQLDLSGGNYGLHIVYGPNEAGKSSSLRAITDLLYGIHSRTPDNFVHPYPRLRIGAQLQHSDGSVLDIIRRKANKNSLFNGDDSSSLDESELSRFLGDVDRELFRMMFGIDHERLRSGGADIARGDGRVGELLFMAGAGLADLQAVQTKLHEEMDALLKSTGRSGMIATDIKEFQESRNAVKQTQVSVDAWKQHDDSLRSAQLLKEDLDKRIAKNRAEQNRLVRIRDSVSAIGQWKKAKDDLTKIGKTPLLADEFDKVSHEMLINLRAAEQQKSDAEASITRLDHELRDLVVPAQLLQESDATESLRDRLGGYRKAMSDRPKLQSARELAECEAKEILRELGRAPDLSAIEQLRLPADKTIRIQNLANQQKGLIERADSARRECDKIRREIAEIEGKLASIQVPREAESLRAAVRDIQSEGDLASQFDSVKTELNELRETAAVALSQLGLWSGSLEEVEKIAVPSLATIEQYSEELKDKRGQIKSLRDRWKDKTREKERLEAQLKQLEIDSRIPTEEELRSARERRERGWLLVLSAWNSGQQNEEDVQAFLQEFSSSTNLADAYRRSVEEADQIADQLRTDADRVVTKVKLQADIEQRNAEAAEYQSELDVAESDFRKVESRWKKVWSPLGIAPLSPLEMRDWLRKQQHIAQAAAEIRTKQTQQTQLRTRIDALLSELALILQKVDATYSVDQKSLREMVRIAAGWCDESQKAEQRFEQLSSDLNSKRDDLADASARSADSQQEWSEWQTNWATEMAALGLQDDALPSQANSVLANVNRLFQKFQESDQYRLRLAGIDRDAKDFDADVRELVGRALPELAEKPVEDAVQLLSSRLKAARSAEDKRTSLRQQRDEQKERLQAVTNRISGLNASLDEMCRQAACESYAQLAEAANCSKRRRDLERAVVELEDVISGHSGGADFVTFLREAEAVDIDSLQPRIDELGECIDRLGAERDEVIGQIKAASIELRKIDGCSLASENAAWCENIASRLEEQVQELAKLRVCAAMLNAAIEVHRQKNQGPVLGRAGEIFRHITLGRFQELRADFDERGEPVLTGVRSSSGESLAVSAMSDGTCDQLFLALRLASLETWLDRHEPMPFIVDDVLLNFDDDRAIASLEVFVELARRTQVVFFTHHQHLVEIATNNLPSQELFVTTLSAAAK